jgi:hypothetical protein
VPYGYVRRYDERTRRFLAQEPDPVKAEVIKELFARLMAGHSFRSISRDFAQRGFVNLSGDPFSPGHLRVLAVNPAYTGLRVHRPTKQNPGRLHATVRSGENTEAVWPALVSRADFMAVQRILGDPKRVTTRPGGAKHLLSMIARCDVCGGVLVVTLRNRASGEYQCGKGGHVRCDKLELDALAEDAILGYLARRDVYTDITAGEDQASAELGQVRADLASARHELDDLRARVGAGRLSLDSLVVAEPLILARIKGLEQQENTLATPSALRGLIEPGPDVAERWEQMPISARRTVARVLLVPERLGQLRVEPRPADYPRSVRQPVKERVVWSQNDPQDDPQEPGAADS